MRYSWSHHRVPGGLVISQPPCPLNLEPASPKLEAPSAGDSFEAVSQRLLPGCPFLGGGPWRPAVLRGVAGFLCRERSCAGTAGSARGMPLRGGRRRRDFSWTGAGRLAPWQPPPGAASGLTSEPVLGRPCGRASGSPSEAASGRGRSSFQQLSENRAGGQLAGNQSPVREEVSEVPEPQFLTPWRPKPLRAEVKGGTCLPAALPVGKAGAHWLRGVPGWGTHDTPIPRPQPQFPFLSLSGGVRPAALQGLAHSEVEGSAAPAPQRPG